MNTTLSSSTSKASIKEPPKAAPIPEESTPIVPEIKEDLVTNGDAEGKICTVLPFGNLIWLPKVGKTDFACNFGW